MKRSWVVCCVIRSVSLVPMLSVWVVCWYGCAVACVLVGSIKNVGVGSRGGYPWGGICLCISVGLCGPLLGSCCPILGCVWVWYG